jgi:2'-5' RNA ligase
VVLSQGGRIRAFFAVELPASVKDGLGRVSAELARSGADVRWIPAENLHLTLKFLGEIEPERLGAVREAVQAAVASLPRFEWRPGGIGAFPSAVAPAIVWAGAEEGAGRLVALASSVEDAVASACVARDARPFSPHVTIGRARSGAGRLRLAAALAAARYRSEAAVETERVTLFRSRLGAAGAVYEPLAFLPLGG